MTLKVLVATRKGLFTLSRNGGKTPQWGIERTDFLADNISLVLHDPRSGQLYAALDHGHFGVKLHVREPDSETWRELPAPAYPEKPDDAPDKDMWGNPLPWSTVRIWALETGAADQSGVLWCGTIPGGLFRSNDHGESWIMVEPLWRHPKRLQWMGGGADLPGLHSICVDPRDPAIVRVAVSTGGVWESHDHGATWHNETTGMWQDHAPEESRLDPNGQDAHRLVQCASSPDRMWIQHHNGIFRSDDSGKTWHECLGVSPSSFGFAVAVHPNNPDIAWFVPKSKMSGASPLTAGWSSRVRATAENRLRFWTEDYRKSLLMTSSTAMASMSTQRATSLPWGPRRGAFGFHQTRATAGARLMRDFPRLRGALHADVRSQRGSLHRAITIGPLSDLLNSPLNITAGSLRPSVASEGP